METKVKSPKNKATHAKTANLKEVKKAKELDKKNAENLTKKITDQKDLMYKYPAEVDTLAERKKFRSNARRTKASFEKRIKKADKGDKAPLQKEALDWATKTYSKANVPTF